MKRFLRIVWRLVQAAFMTSVLVGGAVAVGLIALWLTVNKHFEENEVSVPAISGLTLEEAEERLAAVDLELRVEARRPHETAETGRVYWQEPRESARTRRKRKVRAWISTGPRRLRVPDLAGQSGRAALLNLGQGGLTTGEVVRVHSARAEGNAVIAQDPPSDAAVPDDARVNLLVSRGARRVAWVMPDLRGHAMTEVEIALSSAGLRLAEVREAVIAGVEGGRVASQDPPAGSRVTSDSAISLVVSRVVEVAPGGLDGGRSPFLFTR